jgi:virginiamycin B lyase
MAAGPDGALWFTNYDPFNSFVGRITTSGTITAYTDPGSNSPWEVVRGPDGAMWFGNNGSDSVGRLATSVTPQITKSPRTRGGSEPK